MPETVARRLIGMRVVDFYGERIGTIRRLFVEGENSEPGWALVTVGPLRLAGTVVPLHNVIDDGGAVSLLYEKEHVCAAPSIGTREHRITEREADALHRHYGLELPRVRRLHSEKNPLAALEKGDPVR
jgi:hypothetical protein